MRSMYTLYVHTHDPRDALLTSTFCLQKETFVVLYERFCGLHGLPHAAVTMHLDGEPLKLNNTPEQSDLESGDLIDAKVDFTQQETNKRKRFIRLRLIVQGRRPEVFKIDVVGFQNVLIFLH